MTPKCPEVGGHLRGRHALAPAAHRCGCYQALNPGPTHNSSAQKWAGTCVVVTLARPLRTVVVVTTVAAPPPGTVALAAARAYASPRPPPPVLMAQAGCQAQMHVLCCSQLLCRWKSRCARHEGHERAVRSEACVEKPGRL